MYLEAVNEYVWRYTWRQQLSQFEGQWSEETQDGCLEYIHWVSASWGNWMTVNFIFECHNVLAGGGKFGETVAICETVWMQYADLSDSLVHLTSTSREFKKLSDSCKDW